VAGGGGIVEKGCRMLTVCSSIADMRVDTDVAVDTADQAF